MYYRYEYVTFEALLGLSQHCSYTVAAYKLLSNGMCIRVTKVDCAIGEFPLPIKLHALTQAFI
jgi:hypothetical protein